MTALTKQAGKLFLLTLLAVFISAQAHADVPINLPRGGGGKDAPAAASGDQTVSFGSFVDGVTGTLGKLIPSFGSDDKPADAAKKDDAAPKMIKAKRLDGQNPKADDAQAKAAPPYKVYNAPMVAPDPPMSYDDAVGGRAQDAYIPVRRTASPPVGAGYDPIGPVTDLPIDTSKPPPLPANVQRDLGIEGAANVPLAPASRTAAPSGSIGAALARIPEVRRTGGDSGTQGEVPSVSALPKQFFPIFPAGSDSGSMPQLLPVASNVRLEDPHANVTRAIITVHDMSRNAAESVATLMTLMGPGRDTTLLIAPQFPLSIDIMRFSQYLPDQGRSVARWPVETGWATGADSVAATGQKGISSFTAMDLLLLLLDDPARFPSLQEVVVVGHGMGGDFVQRYAAMGQAPALLQKDRLPVRFVVANPSSYLYFTNARPATNGVSFTHPDDKDCPTYNDYPYGLGQMPPYARPVGMNAIRMGFPERRITYLVGDKIRTDNYLDRSCGAMMQGSDRTMRGRLYERYLMQSFGDVAARSQTFSFVTNAGYDPVSLYGSRCGQAVLFGDGVCRTEVAY